MNKFGLNPNIAPVYHNHKQSDRNVCKQPKGPRERLTNRPVTLLPYCSWTGPLPYCPTVPGPARYPIALLFLDLLPYCSLTARYPIALLFLDRPVTLLPYCSWTGPLPYCPTVPGPARYPTALLFLDRLMLTSLH